MVTTRSGKRAEGATRPRARIKKSRQPKKRSTVNGDSLSSPPDVPTSPDRLTLPDGPPHQDAPPPQDAPTSTDAPNLPDTHTPSDTPTQPHAAATSSSCPLGNLPIEILWEIARALRSPCLPVPRPRELYPLATACKGFWECLRPLLFEVDIIFTIGNSTEGMIKSKNVPVIDWYRERGHGRESSSSALAWSIREGCNSTAEYAIQVARSLGRFEEYVSETDACYRPIRLDVGDFFGYPVIDERCVVDPLSSAIAKGNTKIVEMLTKGASAAVLSRVWPASQLSVGMGMVVSVTPLNLAIWLEEYDVAKIILQRFAEVERPLKWYEPAGLGLASYMGHTKLVRLMLDGVEGAVPESPWAAHIRSQLLDPRMYTREPGDGYDGETGHINAGYSIYRNSPVIRAPMILASMGAAHHVRDGAIYGLLSDKDPHLVTKRVDHPFTEPMTPLGFVMQDVPFHDMTDCVLALIRAGAMEPSLLPPPITDEEHPQRLIVSAVFGRESIWRPESDFIERCWDAALECHGGTADDEFLKGWEEGVGVALPVIACSKSNLHRWTRVHLVWKLTLVLEIISALERKHPGFANLPTIRAYLDRRVFKRGSRNMFSYRDLEGDWTHLMA